MVDQQLIDYIKSVRGKGYSDEAIRAHLLKFNYRAEDIDSVLRQAAPKLATAKKTRKPLSLVMIGIIIFLCSALLVVLLFKDKLYFSSSACKDISVDFASLTNLPPLCIYPDNTKIQLIMQNNGIEYISGADIIIKGEKNSVTDTLDSLNLGPDDVFPRVIDYDMDSNGNVESVTIIPKKTKDSSQLLCNAKKVTSSKIASC